MVTVFTMLKGQGLSENCRIDLFGGFWFVDGGLRIQDSRLIVAMGTTSPRDFQRWGIGRDADMLRQMVKMSSERGLLVAAAGLLVVGIAAGLVSGSALHGVGVALRWVGIGLLGVFAVRRRTVSAWVVVAVVGGGGRGLGAPNGGAA